MYIKILLALPEISNFILSIYKAFKNDNKISLSEAEEISRDIVPLIISLGIPGLNNVKFIKHAPEIIAVVIEVLKQDIKFYKKEKEQKEANLYAITKQQVSEIAETLKI